MYILRDPTWQFIINISTPIIVGAITSAITIWLAVRKRWVSIDYQTLEQCSLSDDENIKATKRKMHVHLNKKTSSVLCLLTVRIRNIGKESIQFANPTPLTIRYGKGVKVLGCDILECVPDYLEAEPQVDGNMLKLSLPILKPNQHIKMQILLDEDFVNLPDPDIYAHTLLHYKIIKASNVRRSREFKIIGFSLLSISIFLVSGFFYIKFNSIPFIAIPAILSYFLLSIIFLVLSYSTRKAPPAHTPLPSKIFKNLLKGFLPAIPILIIVGMIAFIIYHFFGQENLFKCIASLMLLSVSLWLLRMAYDLIKWSILRNINLITKILISAIILISLSISIFFIWAVVYLWLAVY